MLIYLIGVGVAFILCVLFELLAAEDNTLHHVTVKQWIEDAATSLLSWVSVVFTLVYLVIWGAKTETDRNI